MPSCSHLILSLTRLQALLRAAGTLCVGVIGDACLDIYWEADMTLSRLARENPHFILPVVRERMSPGGGSNTAACIAALGVPEVPLLGTVGDDWRGRELTHLLPAYGVSTRYLLTSSELGTVAFCKPLRRGLSELVYEDPHLYFENRRPLPEATEAALLERLEALLAEADALVVADYQEFGTITNAVRERINAAGRDGLPIVVDSRTRITDYRRVILKPNEVEVLWAAGAHISPHAAGTTQLIDAGLSLARQTDSRICLTLGGQGCLWLEGETVTAVPSLPAPPPIDTVGAGDCFAAAFAVALAAGASGPEAAALANLAAGVVVRKIGTTGSATPDEILQRFHEDYSKL